MIDIIFAILIVIAVIKGYQKGFIVAVFSIVAFILGLAAALKLSSVVAVYLQNNATISASWLPFISFAIVFVVVAVLVNMGGKLIEKTFEMAMLGWLNRIGGILLYIVLYIIIFSVFLFYADKIHLFSETAMESSKVFPFVKPWAPFVIDGFGKIVPVFKDMFTQLEGYFESLSSKVAH
ncbi:CvpA family protein [Ferruginibacter paludis]|uniref:CvpA family protein n=1 Tax=Ferruginibacter TaxID=1004303 RepID=UPI0025B6146D|nr:MULTISPECIES: CvpA family protein [Ferruginibacter]MDB5280451.1 CvpA family protein [Ferruginibacter sp.]MDN3658411.1 CvpA family protein [Ferruginibacter paludis]